MDVAKHARRKGRAWWFARWRVTLCEACARMVKWKECRGLNQGNRKNSQGVGGEDWGKWKSNEKRRMETETYKSSCVEKEKEDGWASTRRQRVVNLMGNSSKGIGAGSRWGKKSGRDATSGTGCQRASPHPSSNRKTDYSLLLEHKIFIVQWLRAIPSTWNSQPGCTQNEESNTCILYRTTGKVISLN